MRKVMTNHEQKIKKNEKNGLWNAKYSKGAIAFAQRFNTQPLNRKFKNDETDATIKVPRLCDKTVLFNEIAYQAAQKMTILLIILESE